MHNGERNMMAKLVSEEKRAYRVFSDDGSLMGEALLRDACAGMTMLIFVPARRDLHARFELLGYTPTEKDIPQLVVSLYES